MTFSERFTDTEQQLLATTPLMVGSAMAFAESSGLGTVKELFASAKSYIDALEAYPENEIIQGVLPHLDDRKQAKERTKALREDAISRLKENGIDSQEKMRAMLLQDSETVASVLAQKASEKEAREYREWAMAIATSVASAAREGGFLGFGGTRVSEGEKKLFAEIAHALGADTARLDPDQGRE